METTTNYRLERWIAFLLGLLFFLPFVARADDLLYTDTFHGHEVDHVSGEQFLALVVEGSAAELEPVAIRIKAVYDPLQDLDGRRTGKKVEANGFDDVFLLRSPRLVAGPVTTARPFATDLPTKAPMNIALNGVRYKLDYHCPNAADPDGVAGCSLLLESAGTTQILGTVFTFFEARADLRICLHFAGDLDHDGRLDLLIDISGDDHEWHPVLFLSSAAAAGELVAKAAEIISSGC